MQALVGSNISTASSLKKTRTDRSRSGEFKQGGFTSWETQGVANEGNPYVSGANPKGGMKAPYKRSQYPGTMPEFGCGGGIRTRAVLELIRAGIEAEDRNVMELGTDISVLLNERRH